MTDKLSQIRDKAIKLVDDLAEDYEGKWLESDKPMIWFLRAAIRESMKIAYRDALYNIHLAGYPMKKSQVRLLVSILEKKQEEL